MKPLQVIAFLVLTTLFAAAEATSQPLAADKPKFLGSAYSADQSKDFAAYWNKVTPENGGKWGSVEAERDAMDWNALDEAYRLAEREGFPFQMHVLVWGNQQPEWMESLPPDEQRAEIEEWFAAIAARYPRLALVEVVNEPLNDPPASPTKAAGITWRRWAAAAPPAGTGSWNPSVWHASTSRNPG